MVRDKNFYFLFKMNLLTPSAAFLSLQKSCPNVAAAEIRHLHHLFTTDPSSSELDELFRKWNLSPEILAHLRREDFREAEDDTVSYFVKKFIDLHYQKELKSTGLDKSLPRMICLNNISLQVRCFLVAQPLLVRAFEQLEKIPITGIFSQCVVNYRKEVYNLRDVLFWAAESGRFDIIEKEWVNIDEKTFHNLIAHALRYNRMKTAEQIMAKFDYSRDLVMTASIRHGNTRMMDRMLREGAVLPINAAKLAGKSGNLDMVKRILRMVSDEQKYTNCMTGALKKNQVNVFRYIWSLQPVGLEIRLDEVTIKLEPDMMMALISVGVVNSSIFNELWRYLDHPDTIPLIKQYGGLMRHATLRLIAHKSVEKYDYEVFDLVWPLLVKNDIVEYELLVVISRSSSRYFFDHILPYIDRFNKDRNRAPLFEAMKSKRLIYFVKNLLIKIVQLNNSDRKDIIELLVRNDNSKVFDMFLSFWDLSDRKNGCQIAFCHGKYDYFMALFDDSFNNQEDIDFIVSYNRETNSLSIPISFNPDLYEFIINLSNCSSTTACLFFAMTLQLFQKFGECLAVLNKSHHRIRIASSFNAVLVGGKFDVEMLQHVLDQPFITEEFVSNCLSTNLNNSEWRERAAAKLPYVFERFPNLAHLMSPK